MTINKAAFVHLHVHTEYSLLDSTIRLNDLFKKAKDYSMPAIAITDHGNMFGALDFYRKAHDNGIKPIIGCELCIAPGSRFDKRTSTIGESTGHLVLLVKNMQGYKNLMKLVSAAHIEGFCHHPRVDKELLRQCSEGLIALSACLHGEIASNIVKGNIDEARKSACEYRGIFGEDNFYLEIMENGIPDQKITNQGLIELSKELSIPLVATNNCHYLNADDAEAYKVLRRIRKVKNFKDNDRMSMTDQFYVKSPEEMQALFAATPEAIANTVSIAERCNLDLEFGRFHFPKFEIKPSGESPEDYLEQKAVEGLEKLLPKIMKYQKETEVAVREKYNKRLLSEMEIIKKMGFAGYFLIVADYVNYARDNDISVGPGRGSAGGSLVAYVMRITDVDPLRYGLIFERFLNPDRISDPSIFIDFCQKRQGEIVKHVREKYGKDNVAQICSFKRRSAKGTIRDVGRALNVPNGEVDRIARMVPNERYIILERAFEKNPQFAEESKKNPQIEKMLSLSLSLEGLISGFSTHGSSFEGHISHVTGLVISDTPLVEQVPLFATKGDIVSQYSTRDIETIGLTVFDFLGLKTLTIIRNAIDLVKKSNNVDIDINNLPLDDQETYRLLMKGDTDGVLDLGSPRIKNILIKFKPDRFEDIIAIIAAYRPGAIKMLPNLIARKHGKQQITYEVPQLEPILKETYGIILYQEQVMQIANVIGGCTMAQADTLRRIMLRKKSEAMEKEKHKFLEGAKKRDINEDKAKTIWDQMCTFTEYGFNKAHSTAYAMIAYQCAYLKANYRDIFIKSKLNCLEI